VLWVWGSVVTDSVVSVVSVDCVDSVGEATVGTDDASGDSVGVDDMLVLSAGLLAALLLPSPLVSR